MKTTLLRFAALVLLTIATVWNAHGAGSDSFASRTTLSGAYYVDSLTSMSGFTREFNEPTHVRGLTRTAWWKWTAPSDGYCTFETLRTDSLVDTTITIYTGTTLTTLTPLYSGDNVVSDLRSRVTFYATAGSTYSIAVEALAIFGVEDVMLSLRQAKTGNRSFIGVWQSPEQDTTASANGMIAFKVTSTGAVTGTLTAGAVRYPIKTYVSADSFISATFVRKSPNGVPLTPLTLTVDMSLVDSTILGRPVEVTDGSGFHGVGFLYRSDSFSTAAPTAVADNYTAALGFSAASGTGYAMVKIGKTGLVRLIGVAGDGQKLALGSVVGTEPALPGFTAFPVHQSFFGGEGYLNGVILATAGAPNKMNTSNTNLNYRRPARAGTFYPTGLISPVSTSGTAYRPPAAGQRALGLLDASSGAGKFTITDAPGEIGAITENLTFLKTNAFTFTSAARKSALKLNKTTGLVTGSITEPVGTVRKITGVLHNDAAGARVRGMITGVKRTAAFTVGP